MRDDVIQRFIGIPGHRVSGIYFLDEQGDSTLSDDKVAEVIVELSRKNHPFQCRCGRQFKGYYDFRERFVRDLPWGPWPRVFLLVPRFRVCCPDCGIKTEPLDWIPERCQHTQRLADAVAMACREVRSIQAIAEAFGLSWDTVKRIDKARLEGELNPPDLRGVRHLALDEFSIRRRHTYATIFLDVERNRVLWVCRTREKQAVKEVFEKVFGPNCVFQRFRPIIPKESAPLFRRNPPPCSNRFRHLFPGESERSDAGVSIVVCSCNRVTVGMSSGFSFSH